MITRTSDRRRLDYVRHDTTGLFVALNVADGAVISSIHRKHCSVEFKKFLDKFAKTVPEHLDVHVVCDNSATHKHPSLQAWLGKHPRFHMYFTPTYFSWISRGERLFVEMARELLPRSHHRSVQALEKGLRGWVKEWDEVPNPFIWNKNCRGNPRFHRPIHEAN